MSSCYILAIFAFVFTLAHIITVISIKDVNSPKQFVRNVAVNCGSMFISAAMAVGLIYGFSTYVRMIGMPYVCE